MGVFATILHLVLFSRLVVNQQLVSVPWQLALWCFIGWCSLVRPWVTNAYPPIALGGRAQGARAFYRVRICAYRILRMLRIVYALAVCNMCILQSMRAIHIRGSPVRIWLGHIGTPYTPYLSTNVAPTNPHITGWQLKYVILALCSIYVTYPLYIVSRLYLQCAKHTFSRVAFKWYTSPLFQEYWGTVCVLCSFAFAHLCYTCCLFGNNSSILVL